MNWNVCSLVPRARYSNLVFCYLLGGLDLEFSSFVRVPESLPFVVPCVPHPLSPFLHLGLFVQDDRFVVWVGQIVDGFHASRVFVHLVSAHYKTIELIPFPETLVKPRPRSRWLEVPLTHSKLFSLHQSRRSYHCSFDAISSLDLVSVLPIWLLRSSIITRSFCLEYLAGRSSRSCWYSSLASFPCVPTGW